MPFLAYRIWQNNDVQQRKNKNHRGERMRLLNIKEASKILGIKPKTLYQWKWQKINLCFIKVGGSLRVSNKDLDGFIKKNKTGLRNK